MTNSKLHELCLALIRADSEEKVVALLRDAGYWERDEVWRYYGDIENNWGTIGNQQSRPEAALVEKLVNSVDARLIQSCRLAGVNPEGSEAPQKIRDAVAQFFTPNGNPASGRAGLISEWPTGYRTEMAREVTLATTGAKPGNGHPCFTISDRGEGQAPRNLPHTILSIHRENKLRVNFVQGKFNMGGTGALRFCGRKNLQLVVSRRNPSLQDRNDPTSGEWGFTIVRRRQEGGRNTVFSYLAPVGADKAPRRGDVLSFSADVLPIFPQGSKAYARESEWGTLIKLYEYRIKKTSHVLRRDGLLNRLDLLLPEIALPIRLHECRPYGGHKGSFANNLTGFRVRLEDNRAENIEFDPSSAPLMINGERITATIFAFKKGRADTYRNEEGVIFTINGQTHGRLTTDFFRRKRVGMSYLRDSILVVVDCSHIGPRAREDLFMNSRDRLADSELRYAIEKQLEDLVRENQGLRDLRERRRREEVESKVADDKPLEEVLRSLISSSPALADVLGIGNRLQNPFRPNNVPSTDNFLGQTYPTFFRLKKKRTGQVLVRDSQMGRRARISFETDAENEYFSREVDPGSFQLSLEKKTAPEDVENYSLNLNNGIAHLNLTLPSSVQVGDQVRFNSVVTDITQVSPYRNDFQLNIIPKVALPPGPPPPPKPPQLSSLNLPNVYEVTQDKWQEQTPPFDAHTALRVIHTGESGEKEKNQEQVADVYDFFVNVDNIHLKRFQKAATHLDADGAKLVTAQFKYGLVLLGLALIRRANDNKPTEDATSVEEIEEGTNMEDTVEAFTKAAASVLLPIIRSLGDLELDGED